MAGKFYAVKKGKKPGIYTTWDECKKMVDGYSGAVYKSFKTKAEAEEFVGTALGEVEDRHNSGNGVDMEGIQGAFSFVDGSFNSVTSVYGFGGFLVDGGTRYQIQGAGDDAEMASMRNVAGEILGSRAAIEKALELGLKELTIFYDYMGIEMWATGQWKRNKQGTIAYYDFIQSVKDKINLKFVKVAAHTGIEGNEEADRLAKEAVGLE